MTVCGARACANPGQFLAGSQQSKHRLWLLHGSSHSFCCHFTSRTGYFTARDICIPGLRCTGGQNSINRFHRFAWKYNLIATDRSILCGSNHAARRVKQSTAYSSPSRLMSLCSTDTWDATQPNDWKVWNIIYHRIDHLHFLHPLRFLSFSTNGLRQGLHHFSLDTLI